MDIKREDSVRKAIEYCIENFDSETATNRIVEFWKDELELQTKQCNIDNVSNPFFCNDAAIDQAAENYPIIRCKEQCDMCKK